MNNNYAKQMFITMFQMNLQQHTALHLRRAAPSKRPHCTSWLVTSPTRSLQDRAGDEALRVVKLLGRVLLFARRRQRSRSAIVEQLKQLTHHSAVAARHPVNQKNRGFGVPLLE